MSPLYRLPLLSGLLPAALLIFGPARARGETYRVGPDRGYTELTALPPLQPGDLVEVDGDHTYQGGVVFEGAGTADDPVIIRGLHRDAQRPHLAGGANTVEFRADHYVFEGFEITGGTSRCVFHHADDITIRDSVIHDCPQQGILGADDEGDAVPRPAVGEIDIGAYEYGSGPPIARPDAGVGDDGQGNPTAADGGSAGESSDGPTVRGGCGCRSSAHGGSVIIVLLVVAFLIMRRSPLTASGRPGTSGRGATPTARRRASTRRW